MDRKAWIAVGLSVVGLVLWQWYYSTTYAPYFEEERREQAARAAEAEAAQAAAQTDPAAQVQAAAASPTPIPTPEPTVIARSETISGGEGADFTFNNDTGGIASAILLLHLGENREAVGLNRDPGFPIGALSFEPGLPVGGFTMETLDDRVVFTKKEADGLEIEKTFILNEPGVDEDPYVVNMDVVFRNSTQVPLTRLGYQISAGASAPIHETDMPHLTRFDWFRNGGMESIDVNWFDGWKIPLIGISTREPQPVFQKPVEDLTWAAVTSQYFCTIITLAGEGAERGNSVWAKRINIPFRNGAGRVYGMQGALGMAGFTLAPGETRTQRFQIYSGPKELSRLKDLGKTQDAVMNFGWFGFVSEFLLWAMNLLYGLVHNYAAAIIILTLLIKTALWPLQNKATQSMKRMSLLSPKMTELREKYKDDPAKMNEELMKLYRDYGINPFSGCLPMLIQIPIFFGFYSMLGTAIELRNSSFLWINDLSQPDTVYRVLGFPINLLPLVMAGTMVWQMAITPKTGDKNQQRILMFMPIIFVVFAYNYAAALSLYWTTQNLFSIVQLYLTRNQPLPKLEKRTVAATRTSPGSTRKKRQKRSLQ